MGAIRDRMDGDLRLRGLSEVTRCEYLRCARQCVAHCRVSPALLGAEDVRRYLLHLVEDLHFSPSNMKIHIAAIKFLYTVTLNRPERVAPVKCARFTSRRDEPLRFIVAARTAPTNIDEIGRAHV